ncbi:20913_t:CDS:2, partial [Cetraspora pellucida]
MYTSWFLILTYLILILVCTKSASYNPVGRTEFGSGLVSNKVYYYGGYDHGDKRYNDFFYIDLTKPFSSSSPQYQFMKNFDNYYRNGAATISHSNQLFMFGGDFVIGAEMNTPLFRLCIIQSLSTNPEIVPVPDTPSTPSSRKWHTSVIDHMNKKIYVWGGITVTGLSMDYSFLNFTKNNETMYDRIMYIFDITQSVWTSNPTQNPPIGRCLHTATFVPDGRIIMIGGATNSDVGKTAKKNGFIPSIIHHSATLLPDNKSIIIYGGSNESGYSGLAILNLSSYAWTVISPTGNAPPIISSGHEATLYFDVIIFSFGEYFLSNNTRHLIHPAIRLLNISNGQYRWVDSYTPPPIATQSLNSNNSNKIIIIGFLI